MGRVASAAAMEGDYEPTPEEYADCCDPRWTEPTPEEWSEYHRLTAVEEVVAAVEVVGGGLASATQTDHEFKAYCRPSGRSTIIKQSDRPRRKRESTDPPPDAADEERYTVATARRRQRENGDYAVQNALTTSIVLSCKVLPATWDDLAHEVKLFLARLGRRCFEGHPYPWVKALHEGETTRRPHGHVMVPGYLSEDDVQAAWGDRGLVFVTHLDDSVSVRHEAHYISRAQPNLPENKRYCQHAQGEEFRVEVEVIGVGSKGEGLSEARARHAGRFPTSLHPFYGSWVCRWECEFRSPADSGGDGP